MDDWPTPGPHWISNFKDAMKTLVIGVGISGKATIEYLLRKGYEVVAVDRKIVGDLPCPIFLETMEFKPFDFDLVVVSPGVPLEHPLVQRAKGLGIEIIGEAELAFRNMKNLAIGVTGSNGKSTTVSMIAHVLNGSGKKAALLGNIGVPLVSSVDKLLPDEIVVAEISSFQLETMSTPIFHASAVLNLTPNHLDRHKTMENYFLMKKKIGELTYRKENFFAHESVPYCTPNIIREASFAPFIQKLPPFLQLLQHNAIFAYVMCRTVGITEKEFLDAMPTFKTLPHRLQYVGSVGDVRCYNDSKGTTVDAVFFSVRALTKNVVLIAGGRNKGASFAPWNDLFPGRVKTVILIGEAKEEIARELTCGVKKLFATTMEDAVQKGLQVAEKGDNLLLSPGCTSWDMYTNFEQRGSEFTRIIQDESKRYDLNCCSH